MGKRVRHRSGSIGTISGWMGGEYPVMTKFGSLTDTGHVFKDKREDAMDVVEILKERPKK